MQDNNSTKNNETQKRENPFFLPYGTPHYTVPFHRIQLGDYEEAFMNTSGALMVSTILYPRSSAMVSTATSPERRKSNR